jgi:hypothetical protein
LHLKNICDEANSLSTSEAQKEEIKQEFDKLSRDLSPPRPKFKSTKNVNGRSGKKSKSSMIIERAEESTKESSTMPIARKRPAVMENNEDRGYKAHFHHLLTKKKKRVMKGPKHQVDSLPCPSKYCIAQTK